MPDRERPPRLQPPPRVSVGKTGEDSPAPSARIDQPKSGHRLRLIFVLSILAAGLVGVFVVLPRWQEQRQNHAAAVVPVPQSDQSIPTPEREPGDPTPEPTVALPEPTPPPAPTATSRRARAVQQPEPTRAPSKTEREFAQAMSEGLEALELEHWQAARSALGRAGALRPEAPEVADAVARLEAGQRREALGNAIRRAREYEETEAWGDAEQTYAEILAVDPESARALEGRARAAIRADLDQKLQYHIQYPDRMSSPQVLEDASAALEEARGVASSGPRLAAQISNLELLIEIASKPIPVVLESDNMTEVVVYRYGKLGNFSRRELKLRPGTYTAVGSRTGYRDIRVRFQVSPENASKAVVIRCSEPL
jgi:hypothetical protein